MGERSGDAAERFRDALPKGTLAVVAKAGHNVHGQNTLGFIAAIGAFLLITFTRVGDRMREWQAKKKNGNGIWQLLY